MKIGAVASCFAPQTDPDQLVQLARDLDERGFDSLWFGEHVLLFDEMEFPYPGSADGRLPIPEGQGAPDQVAMIGFLASQTKQLRFGTSISLIPQRNPVYTAKEWATLDWLSGGRVELGVGVGWCKEEVESCGYGWNDRGARCDEALELMQKLWRDPVINHMGNHFDVRQARMDPKPSNGIPLIIGGYSDAALKRTARVGDGWYGFGLTPDLAAGMLQRLDAALAEEGKTRSDINILMMPGDDSMEAAKTFQELGVDRLVPMIDTAQDHRARLDYLSELALSVADGGADGVA